MSKHQLLKAITSARNYAYDLSESIDYNGYDATGTNGAIWLWQDISNDLRHLQKLTEQLQQDKLFKQINHHQPLPVDKYDKHFVKENRVGDIKQSDHADQLIKAFENDNVRILHLIWKNKDAKSVKIQTIRDLATVSRVADQHKFTDLAVLKDSKRHNKKVLCIKRGSQSGQLRRKDCKSAKHILQTKVDHDLAYLKMFKTLYDNRNVYFEERNNHEVFEQISGNIKAIKKALGYHNNHDQPNRLQTDITSNKTYAPSKQKSIGSIKKSLGLKPAQMYVMIASEPDTIIHNGIKYKTLTNVDYEL